MSEARRADIERHFTATAYLVSRGKTLLLWTKLRVAPPGGHLEPMKTRSGARRGHSKKRSGIGSYPADDFLVVDEPKFLRPSGDSDRRYCPRCQPFHQHIDHVYFMRVAGRGLRSPIPHGRHTV